MGIVNALAAGMFLTLGFIHFLAEASEKLESYFKEKNPDDDKIFPWAYFICICR